MNGNVNVNTETFSKPVLLVSKWGSPFTVQSRARGWASEHFSKVIPLKVSTVVGFFLWYGYFKQSRCQYSDVSVDKSQP
jgi:hypothetical protein